MRLGLGHSPSQPNIKPIPADADSALRALFDDLAFTGTDGLHRLGLLPHLADDLLGGVSVSQHVSTWDEVSPIANATDRTAISG